MLIKPINEEVFYTEDDIVKVTHSDIELLKQMAARNKRKRARLCAHRSVDEHLHEMLIVLTGDVYIRSHKHIGKSESFHIIDGLVDVVILDDAGTITDLIPMGNYRSSLKFYYRITDPVYHTIVLKSDFLVFHETTNGPFDRSQTLFAPWAPAEDDSQAEDYMAELHQAVKRYRESNVSASNIIVPF